jgi:hypothetical protein
MDLKQLYENFPVAQINERIKQINNAIDFFKTNYSERFNHELTFLPNASERISLLYFTLILKFSKPFLEKDNLANAYKIASCTEFSIIRILPITNENREVNVAFAVFCALNIIEGVKAPDRFQFDTAKKELDEKLDKCLMDHHDYLTISNVEIITPPVNSNAAWWELLHLFYKYRGQAV